MPYNKDFQNKYRFNNRTLVVDNINYQEIVTKEEADYFDKNITSIHFYHNLIFVFKGDNNEGSNIDINDPESIKADEIFL